MRVEHHTTSVANQSVHHLFVVAERTMRGCEINHDLAAALWAVGVKHAFTHGEVDGIATHRSLEIAIAAFIPILARHPRIY